MLHINAKREDLLLCWIIAIRYQRKLFSAGPFGRTDRGCLH